MWRLTERREYASWCQGILLHSDPGRITTCVCNGSRGAGHNLFAGSGGSFIQPLDDNGRDLGTLFETKNRVGIPVQARNVRGIERYFLLQYPAGGLNQLSTDLILDVGWIHRQS